MSKYRLSICNYCIHFPFLPNQSCELNVIDVLVGEKLISGAEKKTGTNLSKLNNPLLYIHNDEIDK